MKKLLIIALMLLVLCSCSEQIENSAYETSIESEDRTYETSIESGNGTYETPKGYNDNDYQKLVLFAMQGDNLKKLGWDLKIPETWLGDQCISTRWYSSSGENSQYSFKGADWKEDDYGEKRIVNLQIHGQGFESGLEGELDLSGFKSLEILECSYNQLTSINLSDCESLRSLGCTGSNISSIDLTGCKSLESLGCGYNNMTELNLDDCSSLFEVFCYNNLFRTLHVSEKPLLNYLDCRSSKLNSLDVAGCESLENLICEYNELVDVNVSGCISLKSLNCQGNNLTDIDVSENIALEKLWLNMNPITTVDVSKNINLKDFSLDDPSPTDTEADQETETTPPITVIEVLEIEEAKIMYNLLMDNMDMLNTDDVCGIVLLDLDFDGTPELVVSREFVHEYQVELNSQIYDYEEILINSDIYRIKNDELVYVDTIYNLGRLVYSNGNILGLKALENGEKAWFNVSYKNRATDEWEVVDYLFTLEGDRLNFIEVFSRDGSYLDDLENATYRYFGEPLTFEVKEHKEVHIGCDCDPPYTPYYSDFYDCLYFKDFYVDVSYEGIFGKGELYEKLKQVWCQDMSEQVVNLNSDIKISSSKIEFGNHIAKSINDYYNEGNQYIKYTYQFLGDYAKPVIYLYPENETDVSVALQLNGKLTCTYPDYGEGWEVTAYPDGTLINKADGREYSYLYWEGEGSVAWDFSSGFVIKGSDTAAFLQEKLAHLGLKPREYNEFIVYWLPIMQENPYNLISFQTAQYTENARLYVSPEPDSVLRVFMAYIPLENPIYIPKQQLDTFERTGFSVIEWGGTCVER